MKVGVLGNKSKVKTQKTLEETVAFLKEWGHEAVIFPSHREIDGVDVVLVLGGDGAILHSAVVAAKKGIQLIGINYGTLGFLTEYEKDELARVKTLLEKLERKECRIVRRSLLELQIDEKKYYALNEISVQRDYGLLSTSSTQILRLQI